MTPLAVERADWLRIAELVARYADLPLGTVDASVVAAAERLSITSIATFDRRHFGIVRPQHAGALELVPERCFGRELWIPNAEAASIVTEAT